MKKEPLIEVPISHNGLGYVCSSYMYNLVKAMSEAGLKFCMTEAGDSLANRAMNRITNDFLYGDADEMLIVDTDILTTGQHLTWLFEHDVELVYGTYPKRHAKLEHCLATLGADDKPDFDAGPLWSVRRAGRGYVRIKRSLLEKMKEDNGGPALRYHNGKFPVEWDFWPTGVISDHNSTQHGTDADGYPKREFISEDWGFCDRARDLGVPVLVDWRIQTRHIGQQAFPIDYTEEMLPQILAKFPDHIIKRNWEQVQNVRRPTKTWEELHGWFGNGMDQVYDEIAHRIPNGGRFLEVGVWMGKSLAFFAERCRVLEKEIEINAVDTFKGSDSEPCKSIHQAFLKEWIPGFKEGDSFLELFQRNMRACQVAARVFPVESIKAAEVFENASLDAVALDGGHTHEEVTADLLAWLPKVKAGGFICGDDYGIDFPGVTTAVNAMFVKERVRQVGKAWIVEISA